MLDKNEWIRPWAGSDDEVTKMLDIKLIRENPDKIKAGLKAKEVDCDKLIDRILELDEQRRTLLQQTEALKAEQNKVSKQIPALKKAGEDTTAIFKEMGEIKGKISALDGQLRDVVNEYQQDYIVCRICRMMIFYREARRIMNRCVILANRRSLTLSQRTMWISVQTLA